MADALLTAGQAARDLGVSVRTVRRYCEAGKLAAKKVERPGSLPEWLIEPSAVRALAADRIRLGDRPNHADSVADKADTDDGKTATEVRAMNQRLAELTQVMAGLVTGYAEVQKALPMAQEEVLRARAERDEARRQVEALQFERDQARLAAEAEAEQVRHLREVLEVEQRRSWWARLVGRRGPRVE